MLSQPSLGRQLKTQRLHVELGLRETARISKVRHSHLDLIESGEVTPGALTLYRVLKALRLTEGGMLPFFTEAPLKTGSTGSMARLSLARNRLGEILIAETLREAGFMVEYHHTGKSGAPDLVIRVDAENEIEIDISVRNSPARETTKQN